MGLILVIEDDKEVRNFIKTALEKNHLVIEANKSEAALHLVSLAVPDLTVLDVNLENSEQTGAELRHQLSTTPRLAGMPILVVSGYSDIQEISQALGIGEAPFLAKPFTAKELNAAIDKLLASQAGVLERSLLAAAEADITVAIVKAAKIGRLLVIYRATKEALAQIDAEMERLGKWADGMGPNKEPE